MVRPLLAALPGHAAFRKPEGHVDHLVIGAGVVGLAIANALARRWPHKSTYVLERHALPGQETSSRNSEVIHAGLYYPPTSLKTRFCTRGRELLYERIARLGLPARQVGKLIVGGAEDRAYLSQLHAHCQALGAHAPPTRLLSGDEARELEPDLAPEIAHALHSPRTGILDVHALMSSLTHEWEQLDADAQVVYGTSVVRIDPHAPAHTAKRGADVSNTGWVVQTRTHDASHSENDALLARVVINATGLNAPRMLNSLLAQRGVAQAEWVPMYFAKGSYASYRGPGAKRVSHLVYPTPELGGGSGGSGSGALHSLGTHLTLDLEGQVRFGPDVEWLEPPAEAAAREDDVGFAHDFWEHQLAASSSDAWRADMAAAIHAYLPHIDPAGLSPDYAGIRPKLQGPDARAFQDFELVWHTSHDLGAQPIWQRTLPDNSATSGVLLNLLGIESPGVTSALGLAEHVAEQLATRVYGTHDPQGRARKYVDQVGHDRLDAWA